MLYDTTIVQALEKFHKIFTPETADRLAITTGLVQRRSIKFDPQKFLLLMVVKMFVKPTLALTSMVNELAAMTGKLRMTPQALAQRLSNRYAASFLRSSLQLILESRLKPSVEQCVKRGILGRFNSVLIEDSTSCSLHARARESYRGVGGSASTAGYKIHLLWDCLKSDITSIVTTGSSTTDQSMAENVLKFIKRGSLIIRDLGYFSIPIFAKIHKAEAFFVSRLKRGVSLYTLDKEPIKDLATYLSLLLRKQSTLELTVLIGQTDKLPVRLIAHRVSDDVYNQRMRKVRRTAQGRGYGVTKSAKILNRYSIFITNAPIEKLAANEVAVLYTVRWQIELIFKTWKSLLDIDVIKGEAVNRIHCLILARLITIFLISSLFSHVSRLVYDTVGREVSLHKFTSWVKQHPEILVSTADLHQMINILDACISNCYKQRRSRKTTSEYLEGCATYDDLYAYAG